MKETKQTSTILLGLYLSLCIKISIPQSNLKEEKKNPWITIIFSQNPWITIMSRTL